MSVVLLSDETSATQRADRELAPALTLLGYDVTIETTEASALSTAAAHGHHLAARWADQRPDVVIAHGWLAGLAAQVGGRATGLPTIQRFGNLTRPQDDPGRARLECAMAQGAALTLASCTEQLERLTAVGVPRQQIRVVPSGVDSSAFGDRGPTWARNRRRRLVVADDLTSPSAIGALITSLPALPESELLLIGPDSSVDPDQHEVARALVAAAQRLRVADRLRFLGPVEDTELPGLLRSADVVVAPGRDGADVSFVLRAMACGVPVVASDVGAISDAVADGVTGVLVPPHSPMLLGDAVRGLLGDPIARESYGLAATDRARARFSWDIIAAETGRVIDEVLAPRWEREAAS